LAKIVVNDKGNPSGKLVDAELHFSDGRLAGLKLIGFAIWERPAVVTIQRRGAASALRGASFAPRRLVHHGAVDETAG
jgi:hypothetical protein